MELHPARLRLAWALIFAVGCSKAPAPTPIDGCVVVLQEHESCYSSSSSKNVLRRVGDTYASETLVVPSSAIEAAREAALAARGAPRSVLVELGLNTSHLDEAPAKIAAALLPHSSHAKRTTSEAWAELVSESATREEITHRLESQAVEDRRPPFSGFSRQKLEITLPGDPPITITHESSSPFYLPWRIVAGASEWTSADLRLTRALAPLIWTETAFDEVVATWRERVFADASLWSGLEAHAESVLNRRLYEAMRGFAEAASAWRVEQSTCAQFAGFDGEALFLDLRALRPRHVDAVRWFVPLVDGRPANDWNEGSKLAEAAERTVEARPWLVNWKSTRRNHSVELQAVGANPRDAQHVDERVLRAWREAGLSGSPEFEFLLRNGGEPQALVFLAGDDRSGLVFEANSYRVPGEWVVERCDSDPANRQTSYFDANGKGHALR